MRDGDDARDGDDDDDDDAVVEAEEAHARAVAKHLFSKLERHERVESTTTTTSAADESRSNAVRENERALVSLMDKRARDASALDAARARIRELEWERDEARRARGELAQVSASARAGEDSGDGNGEITQRRRRGDVFVGVLGDGVSRRRGERAFARRETRAKTVRPRASGSNTIEPCAKRLNAKSHP